MSVPDVPYFPYKVEFNTKTWDKSQGGPLEITASANPEVISDMTGDAVLPTFTKRVGGKPVVFLKVRDREHGLTENDKYDLKCYVTENSGNRLRTYKTMVFIGEDDSLVRAQPGETVLRFDHESADGTTKWYADSAVT